MPHLPIDVLMSSVKNVEGVDEKVAETKQSETVLRKTSLMQRFANALFSDNEENNHGSLAEEPPVAESRAEKSIERPGSGGGMFVTLVVMLFLDSCIVMKTYIVFWCLTVSVSWANRVGVFLNVQISFSSL